MDVAKALRACVLFKEFTPTGVTIMGAAFSARSFRAGTTLFVEDTPADTMLVIVEGKVCVTSQAKGKEKAILGDLGPGEALGELALLQHGQRMCTATALDDVTVLEMKNSDFAKLLTEKPQACLKLLMAIVRHVGQQVAVNREAFKALAPNRKATG
ncbi:MAG: cyclic nucleotide-binding domain-containing protein [Myxococcaceae bacterium]